jgi:hypothetical protein
MSMSRRQFGQLLAAGALPGILPAGVLGPDEADRLTQAIAQPSWVDPQVIEYFRQMLAEHYTGDKMLGPRQLLGTAMAQLDVLDTLRKQGRPPVAKPLLRTRAQSRSSSAGSSRRTPDGPTSLVSAPSMTPLPEADPRSQWPAPMDR